jgi:hypothetical protein
VAVSSGANSGGAAAATPTGAAAGGSRAKRGSLTGASASAGAGAGAAAGASASSAKVVGDNKSAGAAAETGRLPSGDVSTTTDGEGNLRFRVLKVTQKGVHKPRLLVLNIAESLLSCIRPGESPAAASTAGSNPSSIKVPFSVNELSHIEKSTSEKDKGRAFLVFYGDFRPYAMQPHESLSSAVHHPLMCCRLIGFFFLCCCLLCCLPHCASN